ncbi:MAG TPA: hypothetical protein VN823_26665 [Stellaceae bacterium]|nr:hypothetical protein [Stellaceae bacterium]
MRKVLYVLGALFLVLIVGVGTLVGVTAYKGAALDKESARYVDDAVVSIVAHWNKGELLSRATPGFKKVTSADQLASFFDAVSGALGPLVDYEGSKGEATIKTMIGSGTTITAVYKARAKFQKGTAEFTLTLVKVDDIWMIDGFHVGSDQVMTNVIGRGS